MDVHLPLRNPSCASCPLNAEWLHGAAPCRNGRPPPGGTFADRWKRRRQRSYEGVVEVLSLVGRIRHGMHDFLTCLDSYGCSEVCLA